ncbi:MAG: heme exporter protein CcmB [Alphaproteobacteria bacterium]
MGLKSFFALITMEWLAVSRRGWQMGAGLLLFLLLCFLSPYLGIAAAQLSAFLWVGLLFAVLLGLERLFREDLADGTLARYKIAHFPLWLVAMIKAVFNWLVVVVPLALLAPLLLENNKIEHNMLVVASLAMAGLVFSFYGMMLAALTAMAQHVSLLQPLLLLPLYLPALIFGVDVVNNGWGASFFYLAAFAVSSLLIAPMIAGFALDANLA